MAKHMVNIELRAGGGSQVLSEMGKVGKGTTDLIVLVKKLGNSFGEIGGFVSSLLQNILKGGIWGVMASLAQGVITLFKKCITSADDVQKAVEKAKQQAKELSEAYGKALESMKESSKNGLSAIDDMIKKRKQELEHDYKIAMAEKELQKQRARAAGDAKGVLAAEDAQRKLTKRQVKDNLDLERESYEQRKAIAEKAATDAEATWKALEIEQTSISKKMRDMREDVKKDVRTYNNLAFFEEGENPEGMSKRARARRIPDAYRNQEERVMRERLIELFATPEYQAQAAKEKEVVQRRLEAKKFYDEMKKQLDEIETAERMRQDNIKVEKKVAKAKAIDDNLKAEVSAAQAAAKERERLDREAHQKRMEDLRKEIAAQKSAASVLTSRAASVQSEFDKAFAMYRDPSRAAAEIGEEKDYRSDLDRLHRDARRYGAKWRIDELSSLMAAGDTRGVSDTLAEWRKNKGFTPEVEAMVRASAAENAKTTVEDELRKIETNTAGLDKKLDELLSMK